MTKNFSAGLFVSILLFNIPMIAEADEPIMSDGTTIGYAYMKDGIKFIKVSIQAEEHDKDVELIRITDYGFYPNYIMTSEQINGDMIQCLTNNEYNKGMYKKDGKDLTEICNSNYTYRSTGGVLVGGAVTLVGTIFTLGQNITHGSVSDYKSFDEKKFIQIVKNNDLQKYRAELLSIYQNKQKLVEYANQKSSSLNKQYDDALSEYQKNMSSITFTYSVSDKSGLLPAKLNLEGGYYLTQNLPQKKSFSYTALVDSETFTKENASSLLEVIKKNIDQQYGKDSIEYKKYLDSNFRTYGIAGNNTKVFQYNNNISFIANLKSPVSEIPYIKGKKTNVTIPIIVEYANLDNMIPKEYTLNDTNFNMSVHVNEDKSINTVMSNKTKSFLTVNSLTSYYQDLVYNISNLNVELAPEASANGRRYALFSSNMVAQSHFEKVTKSKAENIKNNYGYAIKYKLNDTNTEKALYSTKNFSLYDIYRQYL